jgi:hypothetical protein
MIHFDIPGLSLFLKITVDLGFFVIVTAIAWLLKKNKVRTAYISTILAALSVPCIAANYLWMPETNFGNSVFLIISYAIMPLLVGAFIFGLFSLDDGKTRMLGLTSVCTSTFLIGTNVFITCAMTIFP